MRNREAALSSIEGKSFEEGKREQMYRMWKRAVTKSFDWMD